MKFAKIANIRAVLLSACLGALTLLAGCSRVTPNSVFCCGDLPGKTIGVQDGTTGEDYALVLEEKPEEGKPAAKVMPYPTGADAVNDLKSGKIDCVIIDNEPAKVFIEENRELQILPDIFSDEEYAIAVRKGNTALTDELNKAMCELKDEGIIDKISSNYIGDNKGSYQYVSPEGVKHDKGKLIMATNAEFPPYEYIDGENMIGIDIDIFHALCDKLGYEPEIVNMEFDDILGAVEAGSADIGMAGITVNSERLKEVDFTDSYARGMQVIITRKE